MQGVLLGFGIVLIIVLVGYGAARILKDQAAHMLKGLGPTVYYITNPALMMMLVADTDLHAVLGVFTPIALITAALSGGLYAVVSRFVLHRDGQRTAVGAMSASYVNAGNIGLPIAVYAIGSSAPVVSVLLAQLLVIARRTWHCSPGSPRGTTAAPAAWVPPLPGSTVASRPRTVVAAAA